MYVFFSTDFSHSVMPYIYFPTQRSSRQIFFKYKYRILNKETFTNYLFSLSLFQVSSLHLKFEHWKKNKKKGYVKWYILSRSPCVRFIKNKTELCRKGAQLIKIELLWDILPSKSVRVCVCAAKYATVCAVAKFPNWLSLSPWQLLLLLGKAN